MRPLQEWICDTCGDLVGENDGWVEFLRSREQDRPGYYGFRICHNRQGCFRYEAHPDRGGDHHLRYFVGPHGVVVLTAMLDGARPGDEESFERVAVLRDWVDVFRRLFVPYYEEARRYFAVATDDGFFSDLGDNWAIERELRHIISLYGGEAEADQAPTEVH